ncbi:MAG: PorV/PorQ family protein [Elusimicrobia bacterium]|nr:PorV/PorQ family protein [Elusimicrobiota bacterium]
MRMRLLTACLLAAGALGAAERCSAFGKGDKGTSSSQFLKIGPGARAAGMAEAFSGVADDAYAAYYNPAGLGFLKTPELGVTHDSRFRSVNYEYGVVAVPMLSWVETKKPKNAYGVLAFSVSNLNVGKIESRTNVETDVPLETFESNDFAYALSYAYVFQSLKLGVGGTLKYVDANISSIDAGAVAFDGGVLWRSKTVSAGMGFRHFGDHQVFAKTNETLPVTFFGGLGVRLHPRFLVSLDANLARDSQPRMAGGFEYRYQPRGRKKLNAAVRAGYSSYGSKDSAPRDALTGLSVGLGLHYDHFDFDGAWEPFGDLGDSFKFSLHVKF